MKDKDQIRSYLTRYERPSYIPDDIPKGPYDIIVVIPCFNEDGISDTLSALYKSTQSSISVLIIVVINHPEGSDSITIQKNRETVHQIEQLLATRPSSDGLHTSIIPAFDLPLKNAGVGLARKIGMDEALRIFSGGNPNGVILCFDADSLCEQNLFEAVKTAFDSDPMLDAVSIHFEHPTKGEKFEKSVYEAIVLYELHLRYHIRMQKEQWLPYAFQTVGSSMAVRASSYAKFGGMNRRQAGEDFYFLQKIIKNGCVRELNTTTIIPSPRISDRVPFGTGKAVGEITSGDEIHFDTYHPSSYQSLESFVRGLPDMYESKIMETHLSQPLLEYFRAIRFQEKFEEALNNTSSLSSFAARMFRHFDAFQLMKYLHFCRDNFFPNIPVSHAVRQGLSISGSPLAQLTRLRKLDKNRE